VPDPIPDTDQVPATAAEDLTVDTAIDLALRTALAARDHLAQDVRLTWAGLHALPALVALLDQVVDQLVAAGYPALLAAPDTATRAFVAIRVLDRQPDLAAQLLAAAGPQ
jgi:hypothetical protein